MRAHGDDPLIHHVRDGRFVCDGTTASPCHNYAACECEQWTPELHGEIPAAGHEAVAHETCWMEPWVNASGLEDSCMDDSLIDFPDGPVTCDWDFDFLTWNYAVTATS